MKKVKIEIKGLKHNLICLSNEYIKKNENCKYKCTIVKDNDINLINFINKNDKNIRVRNFSFLKNYMYLKITKDKNENDIVAFVCLKKHNLFIKDNLDFKGYNSILIDYLCINNNCNNLYNNDNVYYTESENESENENVNESELINISINKFIKEYRCKKVSCFIYNTNKKKKKVEMDERLLCKKTLYYRPLYINRLINCNIFNRCSNEDNKLLKKIYNTFSYHVSFLNDIKIEFYNEIYNGIEIENDNGIDNLAGILSDLLIDYNKKNLQVFEYIDKNEMYNILKDPLFYKFIIRDKYNNIIDFVCMQSSYITNKFNYNIYCKSGNYYCSFYSNPSPIYISYILEYISEYCYKNDIFDIITLNDFFSKEETNYFKLIKKCTKYFYINNIESSFTIHSNKNGLPNIFN
jgi:hypothetical protein